MKRTIIVFAGSLVLIIAGAVYVFMRNSISANEQNSNASKMNQAATTLNHSKSSPVTKPGVYHEYEESLVASAEGPVLLFFYAPWCPQCRAVNEDIIKNGLPDGVTVLKIDYDSNNELRKRYEVTLQTTFIRVDLSGNQISRYVAYNEPTFASVKLNLLD